MPTPTLFFFFSTTSKGRKLSVHPAQKHVIDLSSLHAHRKDSEQLGPGTRKNNNKSMCNNNVLKKLQVKRGIKQSGCHSSIHSILFYSQRQICSLKPQPLVSHFDVLVLYLVLSAAFTTRTMGSLLNNEPR